MGVLILFLLVLAGCNRDFDSPYVPTSPGYAGSDWARDTDGNGVADSVEKYAPGCNQDAQSCLTLARAQSETGVPKPGGDTGKPKPGVVLVESISAPDMRMTMGETRQAQVQLLPINVTSRNYELSSQNGSVAVVRPSGIHASGEGTTLITVHALDGSDKQGQFRVTVVAAVKKVSAEDLTIETDDGAILPEITLSPPEASGADFFLTGGNPAIAVVTADQRHIEPKGPGKTSFKVLARDNVSVWDVFSVTVKSVVRVQAVQAEDMAFSLLNLLEPKSKVPEIDWSPTDATDKGYFLASSNSRVARIVGEAVESGTTGTAVVTLVTRDGGHRTTFNVVVSLLDLDNKGKDKGDGGDGEG
jgi:hypothetical protein